MKSINDEINKLLLVGDKVMSELHLKQPGFRYSACKNLSLGKRLIS